MIRMCTGDQGVVFCMSVLAAAAQKVNDSKAEGIANHCETYQLCKQLKPRKNLSRVMMGRNLLGCNRYDWQNPVWSFKSVQGVDARGEEDSVWFKMSDCLRWQLTIIPQSLFFARQENLTAKLDWPVATNLATL